MKQSASSIRKRPWDKKFDFDRRRNEAKPQTTHPPKEEMTIPFDPNATPPRGQDMNMTTTRKTTMDTPNHGTQMPPHVLIDTIPFYSDRFYLNDPTGIPYKKKSTKAQSITLPSVPCTSCHRHMHSNDVSSPQPPPLFDRARLIQNLDLAAVILGTYTIDPDWLMHELPTLFPPPSPQPTFDSLPHPIPPKNADNAVPCLVLHGHKGFQSTRTSTQQQQKNPVNSKKNPDIVHTKQDIAPCPILKEQVIIEIDDSDDDPDLGTIRPCNRSTKHRIPNPKDETIQTNDSNQNVSKRKRSFSTKDFWNDITLEQRTKYCHLIYKEPVYESFCTTTTTTTYNSESEKENHSLSRTQNTIHQKRMPSLPRSRTISPSPNCTSVPSHGVDDTIPEEGWRSALTNSTWDDDRPVFGNTVYLTEILPCWIPPKQQDTELPLNPTTIGKDDTIRGIQDSSEESHNHGMEKQDKSSIGVTPDIVARREYCRGVHHPKFMLLFERSGSIVVVVTTANLTRPTAADASWVQRFFPRTRNPKDSEKQRQQKDTSEFGFILCDFLQRQSDAAREGDILPLQFLQKHLTIPSGSPLQCLDDLRERYDFETAQVHLISTVPGIYNEDTGVLYSGLGHKDSGSRRKHTRIIRYGPQRVSNIISKLQTTTNTKQDRLLIQQTSFGGKWTGRGLMQLAKLYLGSESSEESEDLLDRVDILWPTQDYMAEVNAKLRNTTSTTTRLDSFAFLSTKSFNDTELACLSRMAMYEENEKSLLPFTLSPHLKTIARVISPNQRPSASRYSVHSQGDDLSWIMLTSACLSRGAQGLAACNSDQECTELSYTNFELGVLFTSIVQGDPCKDRLYRSFTSHQCSECRVSSTISRYNSVNPRIISLPIPYKTRPMYYQEDLEDADFIATPFFHEIVDGTEAVGQMTLTPLGKSIQAQLSVNI